MGCFDILDEVHAVGMYGKTGAGVAEEEGCMDKVDIISGTLGKAYGVGGGYLAGSSGIIDTVRSFAPGFIFTTAPSPVIAAGALASVRTLRADATPRITMRKHAEELKSMARAAKLPLMPSPSHILPIFVGDAKKCKMISDELLTEHSIYIQPINYPTVPRGTERLRITTSPYHKEVHMKALIHALTTLFKRHGVVSPSESELSNIKS